MASKLVQRHKKATILVTEQTLNQAMNEARTLVQQVGHADPRATELKQLYNDIANTLRTQGGAREQMFDDASNPEAARALKAAVDRIAAIKNEIRGQAPRAASVKAASPHLECPQCEQGGFKNQQELDNHVDSAHKGRLAATQEDAPMSSRLFARKKKHVEAEEELLDAAPEAVAGEAPAEPLPEAGAEVPPAAPAAAPAPAPAVAPPTAGNSYANLPTEALTAIAEALTKVEGWESNPAILGAIEQVAEELKNRPMTPAAPEGAPKAASKKVAVTPPGISEETMHKLKERERAGDIENAYAVAWSIHNKEGDEHEAAIEKEAQPGVFGGKKAPEFTAEDAARARGEEGEFEKEAVTPPGWEGPVREMKKDPDIEEPYALAWWMKGEGYTPHKASFMLRRKRGAWLQAKFTADLPRIEKLAAVSQGVPPVNEDTMKKVDGQPHEVAEVGEAHGKTEGVEKAEKHNDKPGDSVTTITHPQDLNKSAAADSEVTKALKTAEQLEKKLGELYLDAKPIIRANASAAVRDAVESIYEAKNKFAEAKKVLNRHEMQATAEDEAQKKALDKKASVPTLGLALAAAE